MTNLKRLEQLVWERDCSRTQMPKDYVPKTKFGDSTSGELAKSVSTWIEIWNGFSTRMSVEGRVIEGKLLEKNVLGQQKRTPSKRIPSSNLKGSADTTGCFLSVRLEVEIKIGSDTMKEDQIKFRDRIKKADGFFMEVKTFDDFIYKWELFINYLPEHFLKMHTKSLAFVEQYNNWKGLMG